MESFSLFSTVSNYSKLQHFRIHYYITYTKFQHQVHQLPIKPKHEQTNSFKITTPIQPLLLSRHKEDSPYFPHKEESPFSALRRFTFSPAAKKTHRIPSIRKIHLFPHKEDSPLSSQQGKFAVRFTYTTSSFPGSEVIQHSKGRQV